MAFDQKAYMQTYRPLNRDKYRAANAKYHRANKDRITRAKWARTLKARYGITPEQYEAMRVAQDGKCAICSRPEAESTYGRLHVDHMHCSGKVRALLCGKCNQAIGMLQENPDVIYAAAVYVRTHLRDSAAPATFVA